ETDQFLPLQQLPVRRANPATGAEGGGMQLAAHGTVTVVDIGNRAVDTVAHAPAQAAPLKSHGIFLPFGLQLSIAPGQVRGESPAIPPSVTRSIPCTTCVNFD